MTDITRQGEVVGTWSPCCRIFREGKVDPGTVHTAACAFRRTEFSSMRRTYYLVIGNSAEKKNRCM